MKYKIVRTDIADALIRKTVLYVADKFDNDTALKKLDELESSIMSLADNPCLGEEPKYPVLRRQGYRVLITEKDLVFYKVDECRKVVTVYGVFDQRQDYLSIVRGL